MTCIAGFIDKQGRGHIAADSMGSNGHTKGNYKNRKIFRKGSFLIGYTSSYRMGQLLEFHLTLPARKVEQTIESYMYTDFISSVRQLLKDHGYLKVDSNRESIGTFIVIAEGRVFRIEDSLAILEPEEGFDACGSGEDYARAAMHLLQDSKLGAKQVLDQAIETASTYVTSVGGPIHHLSESTRGGGHA